MTVKRKERVFDIRDLNDPCSECNSVCNDSIQSLCNQGYFYVRLNISQSADQSMGQSVSHKISQLVYRNMSQ